MNVSLRAWLISVLVAMTSLTAQPLRQAKLEPLRVRYQELPIFPQELLRLGEREGHVRLALSVDTTGKMDDYLVVAHTHPAFARATVAALKKWTFEPAMMAGTPVPSSTEITVNFETQGTVVVSLTGMEAAATQIYSLLKDGYRYRPYALRELDRIPTPIVATTPVYPQEMARLGYVGNVTVGFYIDETGTVRMPAIDAQEDSPLASLAIAALRTWKFEPPTCKGVPVLVKASQLFHFRSAEKEPAVRVSADEPPSPSR
jgi:TonB family protein